MKTRSHYLVLMHLIIFMWGFTGILGKLIHLDAVVIVWYRVLIAFISLFFYFVFKKKTLLLKSKKNRLSILIVGLFVGAHWLTFYQSIQLSTASLGILCLSTTTLHVSWLEPLIMKKKFDWIEMGLSIIVVFGIFITTDDFGEKEYQALAFGLISAVFAALFAVFNTKLVTVESAGSISLYEMLSASVAITIFLAFSGQINTNLFVMETTDLFWLIFLGVACTSFAFLATIVVMDKLGAFTVSLSINLEPIYTLVLAIFILKENDLLSPRFYLGATLIILTVLANGIIKKIISRKENSLQKM